ncbi:hypothetical protein GDO81_009289 [Engystomops pustulosus]|uniref:Uncharacterized protein n=1 Tax=Engystomops pustulosus TaxID=76066 RepID=A0AAV7BQF4_ENGPU|nr:hypothetical protein GDO81_009289 [Engystomops pustulosus]
MFYISICICVGVTKCLQKLQMFISPWKMLKRRQENLIFTLLSLYFRGIFIQIAKWMRVSYNNIKYCSTETSTDDPESLDLQFTFFLFVNAVN